MDSKSKLNALSASVGNIRGFLHPKRKDHMASMVKARNLKVR